LIGAWANFGGKTLWAGWSWKRMFEILGLELGTWREK